MKRLQGAFLAALLTSIGTVMPACAADDNKVMEMAKGTAMFPVRVAAVTCGTVVGTPVAVARKVGVRIRDYTATAADKIGGKEHFPPNLFASFFSVPAGTLVGASEGCYLGPKNAIVHGVEKPFSLESFSLGDID